MVDERTIGICDIRTVEADLPPRVIWAHHQDAPDILFVRRGIPLDEKARCVAEHLTKEPCVYTRSAPE